jgi:uncharacterized protein (DUF1697 family)
VNVGGHKTFRPKALADELSHLDAVNIGAAGTFVIRKPITQGKLRAEVSRRLPFDTDVIVCKGADITRLISDDYFTDQPAGSDIVRFVSVLFRNTSLAPSLPMTFPSDGPWVLKLLAREGRFLIGVYRRNMRAVSHLAALDRLFGTPATTRNWNTMTAIQRALGDASGGRRS